MEILLRASKRARTARTIEERESFYSIFSPEIEWIARGDARSSSGWLAAGWAEAGVRLAAPRDQLAGRGAFHVIAEVIAELVGADLAHRRVRWSGASGTRTHALSDAIRTLSQLSYGPRKQMVGCVV